MQAGALNRRLRLQKVTMTTDSEGMSIEAWSDVASLWAGINPMSATEVAQAAQTEERVTHHIMIRYRTDISPRMRFLYVTPQGTRVFFIHSLVQPDENHREMDCQAEEIVTAQVGAA